MTWELLGLGLSCSENRVARLMNKHGIDARQRAAYRPQTTLANSGSAIGYPCRIFYARRKRLRPPERPRSVPSPMWPHKKAGYILGVMDPYSPTAVRSLAGRLMSTWKPLSKCVLKTALPNPKIQTKLKSQRPSNLCPFYRRNAMGMRELALMEHETIAKA